MGLKKLSLKDKEIFDRYLCLREHTLSAYAFENIYIWTSCYDILWTVIDESLCVFFKDSVGCFMYLPPLSYRFPPKVIQEVFRIMDSYNRNRSISRIEHVEEDDVAWYEALGYVRAQQFPEYLYTRRQLVELSGNKFKSKRASLNYFTKHCAFEWLPYTSPQKKDCFELYASWMKERAAKYPQPIYQGMLQDGLICLKVLLEAYPRLNIVGRVIRIDDKVKGFSIGLPINKDTFCIIYEITDVSVKGISQYIFRRFCEEEKQYAYINVMDDSGLENLKRQKLSYCPVKLLLSYIIQRKESHG